MKKTMKTLSVVFAGLLASNVVLADGHGSHRTGEQILKECGLGGMMFGQSSPLLAVISNITWDLGTTAALSNISSPETCIKTEMRAAAFIHHSYDEILGDSAKGDGKYIQTLATLSGKSVDELRNITLKLVADNSYNTQTQMQRSGKLYDLVM